MNRLWTVLLPELRAFPEPERPAALQRARGTALDALELVGMAGGLAAVTALARFPVAGPGMSSRFLAVLLDFLVAIPLLVAVLGPFHLRRLRRGLRQMRRDGERS